MSIPTKTTRPESRMCAWPKVRAASIPAARNPGVRTTEAAAMTHNRRMSDRSAMAPATESAMASDAPTMSSMLGVDRHYRKNKEKRREGKQATHKQIIHPIRLSTDHPILERERQSPRPVDHVPRRDSCPRLSSGSKSPQAKSGNPSNPRQTTAPPKRVPTASLHRYSDPAPPPASRACVPETSRATRALPSPA